MMAPISMPMLYVFNFNRWKNTTDPYHFAEQVFEYYEAMWGGFDDASRLPRIDKARRLHC